MFNQFIENIKESLENNSFIKITLSNFVASQDNSTLKKILVRKTIIKREEKLTLVYRNKTNDITKNYSIEEGIKEIITFLTKENTPNKEVNNGGFFN